MGVSKFSRLLLLALTSKTIGLAVLAWPQRDAHRQKAFAVVAASTAVLLYYINDLPVDLDSRFNIVMFLILWLSHLFNIILIQRTQVTTNSTNERCYAAYRLLWNGRWVGKEFESRKRGSRRRLRQTGILAGLQRDVGISDPKSADGKKQSRLIFTARQLAWTVGVFATSRQYRRIAPASSLYFHYKRKQITPGIALRLSTLCHHLFVNISWFNGIQSGLSVVFVGLLRLDDPEDWPPMFGSPLEAYTLARFWARFWHSVVYETYTGIAEAIVSESDTARDRSVRTRLMQHFLVFFYSGLMHALARIIVGQPSISLMEILWFSLNFAAICVEKYISDTLAATGGWSRLSPARPWAKVIGWAWVIMFFAWTLPWRYWPKWDLE